MKYLIKYMDRIAISSVLYLYFFSDNIAKIENPFLLGFMLIPIILAVLIIVGYVIFMMAMFKMEIEQ